MARVSRITTPHGVVDCPAFMPVGTRGSVKGITPDQIQATGTQIILANTYHMQLRPGAEIVQELGAVAGLRESVDTFFTDVLINADDEALRNNRRALVHSIVELVTRTADFSAIQG